ncbi:MAG: hypothetical protein APF84_08980 [Gracilibacter sp. BRH_c7a]|nr:MAG: hypothetical protein APF84_08980 [Gracilibacter sp. BRH_c7a]
MSNYDVAAWMFPLESGLKKKHIIKVLSLLPEDCEIVPFEIHENNSSAYGFATTRVIDEEENGLESIVDLLGSVVEDWTNESSEYTFTLPSGKNVYIGCDFRTVIIGEE